MQVVLEQLTTCKYLEIQHANDISVFYRWNGESWLFIPKSYSGLTIKWSSVMSVFILKKDMTLFSFFLATYVCMGAG